jgi:hypothetical protein
MLQFFPLNSRIEPVIKSMLNNEKNVIIHLHAEQALEKIHSASLVN